MSAFTGELTEVLGNTEYRLVLGLRGIATLQTEFGKNLDPIMNMMGQGGKAGEGGEAVENKALPDFSVLFRIVALSLERCHKDDAANMDVVEGLLGQDMSLPGRLIAAAFPQADGGGDTAGKTTAGD